MTDGVQIVTVDATNVDEYGFFCYKSKPKSSGYRQKLAWLKERFSEGMAIKVVYENGRSVGFIEYMPGEMAWRAVQAGGYTLVHCLWVVGRAKNKGYGSRLLHECIADARHAGMRGVAMVTSRGNWLTDKKLLVKNGFEIVDEAPPSFELLVSKFGKARSPKFPGNWEERLSRFGSGLTVVRSSQCPYLEDAARIALETAAGLGLATQLVELKSCQEAQELSPSAYGVFNIVCNGELVSYHYQLKKDLPGLLEERVAKADPTAPSD